MQRDLAPPRWWQTRWFAVAVAAASTIPLWWPEVPPLADLPGHMGRYRIQLDGGRDPLLREWFDYRWRPIGNLGVDLLVAPLAAALGLERGVKLLVMLIPALTVVGMLWTAREAHGRVPPTALLALPLAYAYPFQFGFVNYALALALAFNGFALWLRLGRTGRTRLRAALFAPGALLLWLCHLSGWGVLGLLAWSAELVRAREGNGWPRAALRATAACLPLALPVAATLLFRSDGAGDGAADGAAGWFDWAAKAKWVAMTLRDRWMAWDLLSTAFLLAAALIGLGGRGFAHAPVLGVPALAMVGAFVVLPFDLLGASYVDMRLMPVALALALLALAPRPGLGRGTAGAVALVGLAFVAARLAATTASLAIQAGLQDRLLAALDHVPRGARVASLVGRHCRSGWAPSRLEHLPGMLLVRRGAYSNDQWTGAGQLLGARRADARGFAHEPSQIVNEGGCEGREWRRILSAELPGILPPAAPRRAARPPYAPPADGPPSRGPVPQGSASGRPIADALAQIPREAFDYLWLIEPPPFPPASARGLDPVWRDGSSVLYRIRRARASPSP